MDFVSHLNENLYEINTGIVLQAVGLYVALDDDNPAVKFSPPFAIVKLVRQTDKQTKLRQACYTALSTSVWLYSVEKNLLSLD